ncbi:transglycosylase SLT domain-containing protein [Rhizobium leguminosarum]|uniref:transglycosylase SLT domain-containing protein n=1 Tax=Rhizobium leguminosarum TaxID=384 RepID=UPI001C965F5B|nr:transglycosylase SLT domain-containing protein [Rhizobium leguminosarum]MBY5524328.1 lytic transglycosylase [Rhizobium leguminosarum]MBY5643741.1 lytic transglycosylase [Rhizobium leguminosarum]
MTGLTNEEVEQNRVIYGNAEIPVSVVAEGGGTFTFIAQYPDQAPVPDATAESSQSSLEAIHSALNVAWGKVLGPQLKDRIVQLAGRLGCDPSYLAACMAFETGGTFSPSIQNKLSGATGLIQFMPSTAKALGTSTVELQSMSAVRQVDFVEKYFAPYIGRLKTLSDVYMAILYPVAVGALDATPLFSKPSKAYQQNRGLDVNDDGVVTKGEAASKVQAMLDRGLSSANIG